MILEIVSPEKIMTMENIESIVIPAGEGEMGILNGHAYTITTTNKGKLRFEKDSKQMNIVLLNNGFAHVTPGKTTIILEEF